MMIAPTLHTDRLVIRPFRDDDAAIYARLIFSNPNVMRYLAGAAPPPDQALAIAQGAIKRRQQSWEDGGALRGWALEEQDSGAWIGYVSLQPVEDKPVIEIAYGFGEPYWGKGYATEAARAVLRYGFEVAQLDKIIGLAFAENVASRRVLQKIGLREIGLTDQYYNVELMAYELTREAYLAGNH